MKLLLLTVFISLNLRQNNNPEAEKHIADFRKWYTENFSALSWQSGNGDYTFQLRYLPNEITISGELMSYQKISKKLIKELYRKYDAYDSFTFQISSPLANNVLIATAENREDYTARQYYLIEEVSHDFKLVRDADTLDPVSCSFEDNYGSAPYVQIHLLFEKAKNKAKAQHLNYNDQLFGAGKVSFDISTLSDIQIPKIK